MTVRSPQWLLAIVLATHAVSAAVPAGAINIDKEGTMNLSVRAYVNARVGTMAKQSTRPGNQPPTCSTDPATCSFGGTFPYSGAGNVLQNRFFLEVKWNHDLMDLVGAYLPKSVTAFNYNLTYRGEYEGIYDYGPSAYRHNLASLQEIQEGLRQAGSSPDLAQNVLSRVRHRLRQVASYRNRLFQVFVDWVQGPVFLRFGRQNLAWGETDVFRLLDNINPIDSSFGGFFIDLDERRVPLNMLRASYDLGTLGPFDQAFIEGYVALDNTVAFIPGPPTGSPWAVPLGPPTGLLLSDQQGPDANLKNLRGGVRAVFNYADFTFTLASYQTMFDIPAVSFRAALPTDIGFAPNSLVTAVQTAPLVWVNGASASTALPSLKSILRAEVAVFKDEALFIGPTESAFPGRGITPQYANEFLAPVLSGALDTVTPKDTFNMAVGWDMNQYIRALNPNQTFFFSTQFFYRHIFKHDRLQSVPVNEPNNSLRTVPVPENLFLQTLLINTTYNAKVPLTEINLQLTPGLAMYYDWQGMLLFQPSLRFVRDPFRFIIDYTTINSGVYRYQLGLVRDRSNVRFQIEYVL